MLIMRIHFMKYHRYKSYLYFVNYSKYCFSNLHVSAIYVFSNRLLNSFCAHKQNKDDPWFWMDYDASSNECSTWRELKIFSCKYYIHMVYCLVKLEMSTHFKNIFGSRYIKSCVSSFKFTCMNSTMHL